MHRLSKLVLKIIRELIFIILAILFAFSIPIVLLILAPVYALRYVTAAYAKHFKPELGKILSARSSMFAFDKLTTKPKCVLCVVLIVDGDLTPEEFKDILVKRLLNAKLNNHSDELLHPELKQYISKWMGFYFWKPVAKFDLNDHVVPTPTSPSFDEHVMLSYTTDLIEKPFAPKRSPWEFHLIRNYKPFNLQQDFNKTGILFRVHHSLADGYSILNLMASSTDSIFNVARPIQVQMRKSACTLLLENIIFTLRIPYDFVKVLIESFDINEWHVSGNKLTRSLVTGYHPIVSLSHLKEIKAHYGVTLTAVILELFTGAIRNYMILHNVKVPKAIHCLTALALPGHPKKLRNYMTGCFTQLPVGMSDPVKRLYKIEKDLIALRSSTFPWSASALMQIGGGLYAWMIKIVCKQIISTAVMTNFPGPDRKVEFFSRTLTELNFGGGLMIGNMSLGMSSISYNGDISFCIGLDKYICPKNSKPETLVNLITEEIEILKRLNNNNV